MHFWCCGRYLRATHRGSGERYVTPKDSNMLVWINARIKEAIIRKKAFFKTKGRIHA